MTSTDDPEEFRDRWESHISQLERLGLALPAERMDDLEDAQDDLRDLVDAAAENVAGGDSEG